MAPLREFKIGGTVGKGAKDSLSYATVLSRIKQGKEQGYSSNEVMAAVAKSIKSRDLQDIVENGDLDEETFLEVLKVHYLEKSANSVYNELCLTKQRDDEDEVNYVLRMVGLRKRISKLSEEEGRPMDALLLKDSFFTSLDTGLKQGPVRMELQNTLTNQNLTDKELIREVGRVVAKEKQHRTKMTGAKEVAYVDEVEALYGGGRSEGKKVQETRPVDQEILGAIKDLKVDVNRKLTLVQDDVSDLKSRVSKCEQLWDESMSWGRQSPGGGLASGGAPTRGGGGATRRVNFKFLKCANCEKDGSKCYHCTTCGILGHRRDACPLKNEDPLNG